MQNPIANASNIFNGGWFLRGSTRAQDGNAKEELVQNKILRRAGLNAKRLVTCKQIHSDHIAIVKDLSQREFENADGLLSGETDIVLGVFSADCVPIHLTERERKVVGVLHSGWRGTLSAILKKGILMIQEQWDANPKAIAIAIGPHIQKCCYEVGQEVAEKFSSDCVTKKAGRFRLSLQNAIQKQALDFGIPSRNFTASGDCTACGSNFFSYRRDRTERRMLSYISRLK